MAKIIVYDSDHPHAEDNKCFSEEYSLLNPFNVFTFVLADRARKRGFEIVTSDVFLRMNSQEVALAITDMVSCRTELLLKKGVVPLICFSMESPLVARKFYMNIRKLAGRYFHNIQFQGTIERLKSTNTQFSVMYYPTEGRNLLQNLSWDDKKLLVMINRNKRMFRTDSSNIRSLFVSALSYMRVGIQKLMDPWIRSPEIYKNRIRAIKYFSSNRSFDLYGDGWTKRISGFDKTHELAAQQAFRGQISPNKKLEVLSHYKFAICFENCVFPGYVTEKIFDCFLAGCIPIYLGAPDINDFVPKGSYIDFRDFKNFKSLEFFLEKVTFEEGYKMLECAREFIMSKKFDKYLTVNVVDKMLDHADDYLLQSRISNSDNSGNNL